MSISILPGTPDVIAEMKGQKIIPHQGEGVIYIKFVMIQPNTIEHGDPQKVIDEAPGAIVCGQLSEIKDQMNKWFDETAKTYNLGDK